MSSVLVTGASGFIGQHTLQKLIVEFEQVHAIYRSEKPELKFDKLVWHQLDLFDTKRVEQLLELTKPTHLLHLAWYLEPGKYGNSPLNLNWVVSSLQLIQLFSKLGGKRVVCAGTCFEYEMENGFLSEERTPRVPDQFYGICKKNLSDTLINYSNLNELSLAWGHVFYVYGPHEYPQRLVASVIRSLIMNKTAKCSSGEQLKDYLHVRDVADAFVSILKSDVKGRINIGSGSAISVRDLVLKIGNIMNKNHLIDLGAFPDREGEPPIVMADIRRLKNEVDWTPKINHDNGLKETIDWWNMNYDQ
jgi:nucleoside-diphosphate-sugar epimerase